MIPNLNASKDVIGAFPNVLLMKTSIFTKQRVTVEYNALLSKQRIDKSSTPIG